MNIGISHVLSSFMDYWTALPNQFRRIAPVPIPVLWFLRNLCNQESLKGTSFDSVFHGNLISFCIGITSLFVTT